MNYAPVVRINGTMMYGDIVFPSQSAATFEITIHTFRDLENKASGDLCSGVRRYCSIFGGGEIIASGS